MSRWAPLAAVIAIQLAILVAIPFRRVEARLSGTDVTLRTVPVDPYDVLSGYYVTLRYEVEPDPAELRGGTEFWLRVRRAEPAWAADGVSPAPPEDPPGEGAAVIRLDPGAWARGERGTCLIPSACRFYIPEARREQVAEEMRKAGGVALVDLRVDDDGNVALVRLRVGGLVLAN